MMPACKTRREIGGSEDGEDDENANNTPNGRDSSVMPGGAATASTPDGGAGSASATSSSSVGGAEDHACADVDLEAALPSTPDRPGDASPIPRRFAVPGEEGDVHIEALFRQVFGNQTLKKSADRLRRVINTPQIGSASGLSGDTGNCAVIYVGLDPLVVLLHAPTCVTLALVMPLSFTDANGRAGLMALPEEELHDAKEVRGNILAVKINGELTAVC